MNPEQIEVMMRLRGANEYTRNMQKATVATTEYGTAAQRAGLQARDASGRFTKAGTEMQKSSKVGLGAFEKMKKVGANMRSTGKNLTTHLTLPIVAAGAYAVHTAAEFGRTMNQVRVAGDVGGKGMTSLESLAKKMGQETIFSSNEAAEAMLELTKSGITPAQIKAGALASTINLAATEGLALGRTGEIMAASMNTFGIKAKESQLVADALAGGANASSASVQGLAESLSQGGQSAAMYGLSINETIGALAAFAQNGIQASDAGTSFKTFMMKLNPTAKKQKEVMKELNLSFFDSHGRMVGLSKIAGKLRTALSGYTQEQRNAYLQTIFGSDAQRAANIIYKEGEKGIMKYVGATEKQGGAASMASAFMEGLGGKMENLQGSVENMALAFGKALAPAIELVAGWLTDAANAFSELSPQTQKWVIIGLVALAVVGPMVYILGALATVIGAVGTALLFLAANPIVLAVIAIAAGFAYLYLKVEWFHNAIDAIVGFIKAHWRTLLPLLLAPFFPFIAIIVAVVTHLDWFKNAFNNVVAFFRALPGRIMAGIRKLPRLFGQLLGKLVVLWATLPVRIFKLQLKLTKLIVETIIDVGPKLFTAAIKIIGKMLAGLKNGWVSVMNWIHGLPGTIVRVVGEMASQFFNVGKKIASEIAKGFYESLPGPLKDTLGAAADAGGFLGDKASDVGGFVGGLFNASGTTFFPGGWTWVGEQGPELIRPPRGSEIMNAARSHRETTRAASVGPLRTRSVPTPIKLDPGRQNGAYRRSVRREQPIKVELKVDRRKFGEAMALAMLDEEVNE